jgi:ribose-phosphate pyrophosphokinase
MGVRLAEHEERDFEDGEHKARPLESVRDKSVFVIQSLYGDDRQSVNDKLCRLLFFLGALRDASAARVTAVIPYLCYARKDRKSKPRDPVTTRYVAAMFEAVGINCAVLLDVHNLAAIQNAWRIPVEHLEAKKLFVGYFAPLLRDKDVIVVSPDAGGVKRAEDFRQSLAKALGRDVRNAFIEKYRSAGVVTGHAVVGEVRGRVAVLLDDLISSGTTMVRAAEACRDRGATAVYAVATHAVFGRGAQEALSNDALDKILVTDSVAPGISMAKLQVLSVAGLFADAISRIHSGGSVVELLQG